MTHVSAETRVPPIGAMVKPPTVGWTTYPRAAAVKCGRRHTPAGLGHLSSKRPLIHQRFQQLGKIRHSDAGGAVITAETVVVPVIPGRDIAQRRL